MKTEFEIELEKIEEKEFFDQLDENHKRLSDERGYVHIKELYRWVRLNKTNFKELAENLGLCPRLLGDIAIGKRGLSLQYVEMIHRETKIPIEVLVAYKVAFKKKHKNAHI